LTVTGPDMLPQRLELTDKVTLIGRTAPSAVVLPGHNISRTHCRIDIEGGRALLTDLNSTNGTVLDGQRLAAPQALSPGAKITLGEYTLLYHFRLSP
jgi:pSer/pThr/pTyr-binding forkhead associated (FHA) protein